MLGLVLGVIACGVGVVAGSVVAGVAIQCGESIKARQNAEYGRRDDEE